MRQFSIYQVFVMLAAIAAVCCLFVGWVIPLAETGRRCDLTAEEELVLRRLEQAGYEVCEYFT